MNLRLLEKGNFGAFFRRYNNLVFGVITSLSSKMHALFFYKVVQNVFIFFFLLAAQFVAMASLLKYAFQMYYTYAAIL